MPLHVSSTVVLIIRRSKLYYTASGITSLCRWPSDLMHKFLFYNKFIVFLYMFRALCAHHQEVKIALYSLWYRHTETSEWSKVTKIQFYINMSTLHFGNFRPLTCFSVTITRCCIMQFRPPDDEHIVLETCRGI